LSSARDVARAIDALKRGWPISIDGASFLAIETADSETLAAFDADGAADLLIAGNRAVTLKLANQIDGVPTGPVRVIRTSWIHLDAAIAVADPALDLATPLKGPFRTAPLDKPEAAAAALRLARAAGLLPAFFLSDARREEETMVSAQLVAESAIPASLRVASRARLPIRLAQKAEIIAFRSLDDAAEHVALLVGDPNGKPPLVRIHSECLTGDVLGSLKCDCGPQLDDALEAISASGWGILLYLRQEGRGIGLVNKLRAYALQDQGFDTVDSNLRLGFGDDERDFSVAAAMLKLLSQDAVRLLTNNPRKVIGLEALGVEVVARVPLLSGANPHNRAYLESKRLRSGHHL